MRICDELKEIFRRLNTQAVYPHQLAFMLLIPLRNLVLSPQKLIERLELAPDQHILEVGCGPGYFSPTLARTVPQGWLTVADIQPKMLDYAKKRLQKYQITNADCYLCDGIKFDFPDQSFDRIVLVTVLGEVSRREEYLKEFNRLLKPSGLLCIAEAAGDPDKLSIEEINQLITANTDLTPYSNYGDLRNFTLNFKKPSENV